ncbi:MAG TPA: hypothetical protein VNM91_09215 [Dehalococcoidia bacterium]|nr:hypothetical protein [Dehalococcoidia bacterium]
MKLRRKKPNWFVAEHSPQGYTFWASIGHWLGGLECAPVAETRDRRMIFALSGDKDSGVLVETREVPEGNIWRSEMAFRSVGPGPVFEASLTAHGWDPWLHAEVTGDREVLDLPPKRRRKIADERSAVVASERDECRIAVVPEREASVAVLGISLDEIMELLRVAQHDAARDHEADAGGGRDVADETLR